MRFMILLLLGTMAARAAELTVVVKPYVPLERIGGFGPMINWEAVKAEQERKAALASIASRPTITHDQWLKQKKAFDEAQALRLKTNLVSISKTNAQKSGSSSSGTVGWPSALATKDVGGSEKR